MEQIFHVIHSSDVTEVIWLVKIWFSYVQQSNNNLAIGKAQFLLYNYVLVTPIHIICSLGSYLFLSVDCWVMAEKVVINFFADCLPA